MVQIRSFIEGVSLAESKNSHDFVSRKEPVFTATVDTMPISYRFIPIYGATNYGPMCSILEVGDVCDLKELIDN